MKPGAYGAPSAPSRFKDIPGSWPPIDPHPMPPGEDYMRDLTKAHVWPPEGTSLTTAIVDRLQKSGLGKMKMVSLINYVQRHIREEKKSNPKIEPEAIFQKIRGKLTQQ